LTPEIVVMAVSGVSSVGAYAASQQVQSLSQHKHGSRHHASSLSDVDAQSSSVATGASSTKRVGGKLDITA
jgi:hypothetical protein